MLWRKLMAVQYALFTTLRTQNRFVKSYYHPLKLLSSEEKADVTVPSVCSKPARLTEPLSDLSPAWERESCSVPAHFGKRSLKEERSKPKCLFHWDGHGWDSALSAGQPAYWWTNQHPPTCKAATAQPAMPRHGKTGRWQVEGEVKEQWRKNHINFLWRLDG